MALKKIPGFQTKAGQKFMRDMQRHIEREEVKRKKAEARKEKDAVKQYRLRFIRRAERAGFSKKQALFIWKFLAQKDHVHDLPVELMRF